MVVFGGYGYSYALNDTWALNFAGGTPSWGMLTPLGTAPLGRGDHASAYDSRRDAMVVWFGRAVLSSASSDVWRLVWGTPVPVQLSLVSAQVEQDRVVLAWHGAEAGLLQASVERRTATTDWVRQATIFRDGTGDFRFEDRELNPGARYGYRLAYTIDGPDLYTEEYWVDVPTAALAIRWEWAKGQGGDPIVTLSLPSDEPAVVEAFDVGGRRVERHDVVPSRPGVHELVLGTRRRLPSGVVLLRLTQGDRIATARGIVIR